MVSWRIPATELPELGRAKPFESTDGRRGAFLVAADPSFASSGVALPASVTLGRGAVLPRGTAVVGYLNVCTHMGCKLVRKSQAIHHLPDRHELVTNPCPCHGTTFDLARDGLVILGQATVELPRLNLAVEGADVVATLSSDADPIAEHWERD